jgi:cold shock CspA family protein
MRTHGTLTRWNDDRGFGFITPAKGTPEIFVHISEFPREGGRPTIGELISFEVASGRDGKQRAVRIMRPGRGAARSTVVRARKQPQSAWLARMLGILVVTALGAYGYSRYQQHRGQAEDAFVEEAVYPAPAESVRPVEVAEPPSAERNLAVERVTPALPASRYSCDGRTMCSQMHSCEEATYFIRNCPDTKMDGNLDGVPCESQWCN